ncbi:hypothetical protein ACK3TF_003819 [Chlorella vulgaris]
MHHAIPAKLVCKDPPDSVWFGPLHFHSLFRTVYNALPGDLRHSAASADSPARGSRLSLLADRAAPSAIIHTVPGSFTPRLGEMANDRAAANLVQQVMLHSSHGGNVAHLGGLEVVPLQGSFQ